MGSYAEGSISIQTIWNPTKICLFSHYLIIQSFTHIIMNSWLLYLRLQSDFIVFLVQIVSALAIGSPFSWLLKERGKEGKRKRERIWMNLYEYFFDAPLFSGNTRCSRLILYASNTGPQWVIFQKALVPFIGEGY